MEKRSLICIGCPMGCQVTVGMENGAVLSVEGNTCKRGDIYARKEVTNPTRIVTSTVVVEQGEKERLPVKTACDIPKTKIFDVMHDINRVRIQAPVHRGAVVLRNAGNTGVDVLATGSVEAAR